MELFMIGKSISLLVLLTIILAVSLAHYPISHILSDTFVTLTGWKDKEQPMPLHIEELRKIWVIVGRFSYRWQEESLIR